MVKRLRIWWLRRLLSRVLHQLNDLANARDHALFCYDMEAVDALDTRIKQLRRQALRHGAAITFINRRKP